MLRCVFLAVSAMLLVACATITRGTTQVVAVDTRRAGDKLHYSDPKRAAGGHDPGIGDPFQGVELASNPMHEGVLSARIEHHSVERRKHGCWQCDLRRHHRTWGRCRLRGDEQIPRRGHCRDDAGSGMPRPGTGPAEPGTAAAHLGAVVFRADPRARGGAGTFSGWRWLRRRPFRRLKLSLLGPARETTAFAGILPFFSNAFRALRVNLKANIARGERTMGSCPNAETSKQTSNCLEATDNLAAVNLL